MTAALTAFATSSATASATLFPENRRVLLACGLLVVDVLPVRLTAEDMLAQLVTTLFPSAHVFDSAVFYAFGVDGFAETLDNRVRLCACISIRCRLGAIGRTGSS